MRFLKKSFLVRRRLDNWFLGLSATAMPIRIGLGPLVLFLFSCVGIYLVAGRHRAVRLFAGKFYIFALLYAVWTLGLIIYRGEPIISNRQVSYTLLFTVFAFAGPGMVLVRDPLRAYVLGSRIGTTLALMSALWLALMTGERVGVGGNAAVFAFVAGVAAISAAIPLSNAPRYLPNGPHWLVIGIAAVMLSETRAVLVVLPVFAVIEIVCFLSQFNRKQQGAAYLAIAAILAALVVAGPVGTVVSKRFSGMIEYYDTGDSSQWTDKISADIREVMWESAGKIILKHPLIGVGGFEKMADVRSEAGANANMLTGYLHVHNTVLDELLNNGLIGLFFLLGAVGSIFVFLWRNASSAGMVRAVGYFAVLSVSYGMLHNPLLHEASISATMLFFAALNAAAARHVMAQRRALKADVIPVDAGYNSAQ